MKEVVKTSVKKKRKKESSDSRFKKYINYKTRNVD